MQFFESFLQVGIVVFAFPLVGSWVTQLIGEPTGSNYKDKGHNILTIVCCVGLVLCVFWLSSQMINPIVILIPALVLIICASAMRMNYERDYDIKHFMKTSAIKFAIAIVLGLFISSGK